MYNLLSNAAKFTPDGGSIKLTARLMSRSDNLDTGDKEAMKTGDYHPGLDVWRKGMYN